MSASENSVRIVALCATIAMTSLPVLSQLGLADHYPTEADAILAAQRSARNNSRNRRRRRPPSCPGAEPGVLPG